MTSDPLHAPQAPVERRQTDVSLTHEREKTDDEIAKRQAEIDANVHLIEKARERADVVMQEARHLADETLEREGRSRREREAIIRARAKQDEAVAEERRVADALEQDERQERLTALASLLRLEREQTNERLVLERAKADVAVGARDDLLAMVSHDLRSLLGGIALAASVQLKTVSDDETGRRITNSAVRIQRFTARMNRLIGDLLDVSSIEAGKLSVTPAPIDAARVLREALELFQHAAAAKNVALTETSPSGRLDALADEGRVLQVLVNLLSNAIKFANEGGAVTLSVETVGGEVRFAVTDDGPGIAREHHEAVFDRYWQVRQHDARGVGLGLFISRRIIEAQGGHIWVESEPGRGSRFCFTVPRAHPPAR
ncbi:MAG: hypothetical protein JNK82_13635 [Myxococcaceae bacterium]|nr:hypothetical protein [Myxococcaceae bacterium]